jgi:hypothetical protein
MRRAALKTYELLGVQYVLAEFPHGQYAYQDERGIFGVWDARRRTRGGDLIIPTQVDSRHGSTSAQLIGISDSPDPKYRAGLKVGDLAFVDMSPVMARVISAGIVDAGLNDEWLRRELMATFNSPTDALDYIMDRLSRTGFPAVQVITSGFLRALELDTVGAA